MLHHFVCWYVKCVEKVPFRKSGHICALTSRLVARIPEISYAFRQWDLPKRDIQVDRGADFKVWRANIRPTLHYQNWPAKRLRQRYKYLPCDCRGNPRYCL